MASTDPERNDPEAEAAGDDEDTGAVVQPIVKLEEVAVTTGEEDEDALLDLKSKLYRFDKEGNQWKERGVGNVKILKHKEHAGNDKSCVWHAPDFADGELKDELFCIRFGSVENCKKFMEVVQDIVESLGKKGVENKDAADAADLLDKLTVEGEKKDAELGSTQENESKPAEPVEKKTESELEAPSKD